MELHELEAEIMRLNGEIRLMTDAMPEIRRDMRKLRKLVRQAVQEGELTQAEADVIIQQPEQELREAEKKLLELRAEVSRQKEGVKAWRVQQNR